ncbi:LacI family transcriptional regulator [Ruminococcaceae bacterium OttesenSCG-928-I18]|nr:LacI family transcriptional regulator [Ruminococcaceae bacterium OttesenSCG-928-I18]
MVTMKQLAEEAGVSITTVSNVVHGNTKRVSSSTIRRVQALMQKHNYVPRTALRALSGSGSKIIGVVAHGHKMHDTSLFGDHFYAGIVGTLEPCIRKAGYYLMLYASDDVEDIYRMAATWNVDGMIAISFSGTSYQKLCSLCNKPIVGIDMYNLSGEEYYNVGLEDEEGGYQMTRFLLQNGYTNALLFADADVGVDHHRWLGFRRAYAQMGLPCKKSNFVLLGGGGEKIRKRHYEECSRKIGRETAWFFVSDHYAVEAMRFLQERGFSIPGDVGVAGFDDAPISNLVHPALTTVHQSIENKATAAFQLLLQRLQGQEIPPRDLRLPTTLFIRNSVRRL